MSGVARRANARARANLLPHRDVDSVHVGIDRDCAVPVADLDLVAVATFVAGRDYDALRHGEEWGAHRRCEVVALVHAAPPIAESGGEDPPGDGRCPVAARLELSFSLSNTPCLGALGEGRPLGEGSTFLCQGTPLTIPGNRRVCSTRVWAALTLRAT